MNSEDRKVMEMARDALKEADMLIRYVAFIMSDEKPEEGSSGDKIHKTLAAIEERLQADEKVAYPEGDVVGPCICGSWPGGKCCRCPQADEKEEPVMWVQSDHLTLLKQHSSPSFLARCSDHQLHPDYVPLYAHGRKGGD